MRLVYASATILPESISYTNAVEICATAAAACYGINLERKTFSEKEEFIRKRLRVKHESVIEHASITVKFVVNRGFTHEMVRHRLAAFTQESTRYCDLSKDKFGRQVTYIIPVWCKDIKPGIYTHDEDTDLIMCTTNPEEPIRVGLTQASTIWMYQMLKAEKAYFNLLKNGWKPEEARDVLPTALKADLYTTCDMREWRHICNLRALNTSGPAHPHMLEVMVPLLTNDFKPNYNAFFGDL